MEAKSGSSARLCRQFNPFKQFKSFGLLDLDQLLADLLV